MLTFCGRYCGCHDFHDFHDCPGSFAVPLHSLPQAAQAWQLVTVGVLASWCEAPLESHRGSARQLAPKHADTETERPLPAQRAVG